MQYTITYQTGSKMILKGKEHQYQVFHQNHTWKSQTIPSVLHHHKCPQVVPAVGLVKATVMVLVLVGFGVDVGIGVVLLSCMLLHITLHLSVLVFFAALGISFWSPLAKHVEKSL